MDKKRSSDDPVEMVIIKGDNMSMAMPKGMFDKLAKHPKMQGLYGDALQEAQNIGRFLPTGKSNLAFHALLNRLPLEDNFDAVDPSLSSPYSTVYIPKDECMPQKMVDGWMAQVRDGTTPHDTVEGRGLVESTDFEVKFLEGKHLGQVFDEWFKLATEVPNQPRGMCKGDMVVDFPFDMTGIDNVVVYELPDTDIPDTPPVLRGRYKVKESIPPSKVILSSMDSEQTNHLHQHAVHTAEWVADKMQESDRELTQELQAHVKKNVDRSTGMCSAYAAHYGGKFNYDPETMFDLQDKMANGTFRGRNEGKGNTPLLGKLMNKLFNGNK